MHILQIYPHSTYATVTGINAIVTGVNATVTGTYATVTGINATVTGDLFLTHSDNPCCHKGLKVI